MAPGSWATFNCNYSTGTLAALLSVGGGKICTEYADKMVWDASRRQIYFTGGGHGQQEKTIVYNDDTNTWTDLGSPPWYTVNPGSAIHGYQHNALEGDTHYYLIYGTQTVRTRNVTQGNASWSTLANSAPMTGATGALEWFPTYGANGSLIAITGADIVRWNKTTGTWSSLPTQSIGPYHNFAVYSPIRDILYFGGGNGSAAVYKMSNTGTITACASCPVDLGIIASVTTIDPLSGNLWAITSDQVVRIYDSGLDSWSTDTAPPAGFWAGIGPGYDLFGTVAVPVYDYGVTMFLTAYGSGPTVYLRKGG
jgi:hypothetical protein